MKSAEDNPQQDALVMVHQRNAFYKNQFHVAMAVYILSFIVIIALIFALIFLVKNPTKPIYFVADDVARLMRDTPRIMPNMSADDVGNWVVEAIENSYSYDFVNYRRQLQNAQKYFTDYGWRKYMDGLTASNNLLALTQRKMVLIARVVEKPKLVKEAIIGGAHAWKFQVPVLLTVMTPPFNDKTRYENPLYLSVVVQRQSMLTGYNGLGIVQLIGEQAQLHKTQNLVNPPS